MRISPIVIALLAGLVGAAFLFWEPQGRASSRSKISRVKSDMRSLATCIETYFLDNASYLAAVPMSELMPDDPAVVARVTGVTTIVPGKRGEMLGLTTPIAYSTSLFGDPYAPRSGENYLPYAYYTDGPGWITWSPGPDLVYDIRDGAEVYDNAKWSRPPMLCSRSPTIPPTEPSAPAMFGA